MDVASKILEIIRDQWSISNPSLSEVALRLDEYDPKNPLFQIVVENYPIRSRWIIQGVYRVEHRVKITLYCKPKRYDLDSIESLRVKWYNMKGEVDRILMANKFNVSDVNNLDLPGGWDDRETIAVGRGIKKGFLGKTEPIIWLSEQVVTCVYYEVETLESE
ncbi:MAG: hypothetical protein ACPLKS_06125 [Caldisericum exile]|uniref:hypothetical protein n=1 Tax=Caldisericum exile TaxID=693075 RepID=UPI003C75B742